MIESILQQLPADVREDLAARTATHLDAGFLRLRPAADMDDRLDTIVDLGTMPSEDLVTSLARWTAYAGYVGELVVFTNIIAKRIEHFMRLQQARIRTHLTGRGGVSSAELASAAIVNNRMRALDEAHQSVLEVRAVLEHRERACRAAAEAASRAITARQTEIQRLRLEARRG